MTESTQINLINAQDVDIYLKKFCNRDPRLEIFLITAVANVIKKSPEYMEVLKGIPDGAPQWLTRKWNTAAQWHWFEPKKNIKLAGRIHELSQWLEQAIEYDLHWIHNTDERGRPKKLLKLGSFEQIYKVMVEDRSIIAERERLKVCQNLKEEKEDEDIRVAMSFDGGHRIVKLLTTKALDRETAYMQHCIGNGAYDLELEKGDLFYYSVRNAENIPCLTFSVDYKKGVLREAAQKRNRPAEGKYIRYLATFCYQYYIDMSGPFSLGEGYSKPERWDYDLYYPSVDKSEDFTDCTQSYEFKAEDIITLPDGARGSYLYISEIGNLDIFPKNVRINGNVYFFGTHFPVGRPEGWLVTGKIRTNMNVFDSWDEFLNKHYPLN